MIKELQVIIGSNITGLTVLSVAIACDVLTGLIKAVLSHDLKSSKFKDGLLKKTLDYVLVVIGCSMDLLMKSDYISTTCVYCLVAMEFYSCIENLREYMPVPDILNRVLDSIQKRGDEE